MKKETLDLIESELKKIRESEPDIYNISCPEGRGCAVQFPEMYRSVLPRVVSVLDELSYKHSERGSEFFIDRDIAGLIAELIRIIEER